MMWPTATACCSLTKYVVLGRKNFSRDEKELKALLLLLVKRDEIEQSFYFKKKFYRDGGAGRR